MAPSRVVMKPAGTPKSGIWKVRGTPSYVATIVNAFPDGTG